MNFTDFKYIGESAAITSSLLWACSIAIYSHFGRNVTGRNLNLFKNSIAVFLLGISLLTLNKSFALSVETFIYLSLSGIIGLAIADSYLLNSLKTIGPQKTTAIQCLVPPFAAISYYFIWGEALTTREMIGMALALTCVFGIICLKSPNSPHNFISNLFSSGIKFAMISAICQSIGWIFSRKAMQEIDFLQGSFIRISMSLPFLLAFSWRGKFKGFSEIFASRKTTTALLLAAFFGTFLGLTLISIAAKYAKVGVSSTLGSLYPVFIIPISVMFLKEKADYRQAILTIGAVFGVALMML